MSNHTDKEMAIYWEIGQKATQSLAEGGLECGCSLGEMVMGAAAKASEKGLHPLFVSDVLRECADVIRASWDTRGECDCGCQATTH
jgi:hypothetical protein